MKGQGSNSRGGEKAGQRRGGSRRKHVVLLESNHTQRGREVDKQGILT